jgi:hypothetical protein
MSHRLFGRARELGGDAGNVPFWHCGSNYTRVELLGNESHAASEANTQGLYSY